MVNYQTLFLIPSGTALVAAVLLLLFFHPPRSATKPRQTNQATLPLAPASRRAETGIPSESMPDHARMRIGTEHARALAC